MWVLWLCSYFSEMFGYFWYLYLSMYILKSVFWYLAFWNFYLDCREWISEIQNKWHLNNVNSSNPLTWDFLIFFISVLDFSKKCFVRFIPECRFAHNAILFFFLSFKHYLFITGAQENNWVLYVVLVSCHLLNLIISSRRFFCRLFGVFYIDNHFTFE